MPKYLGIIYPLIPALFIYSSNVNSGEISFDYIQGSYLSITDSSLGVDVDATGFELSGSFSLSQNIAITALYGTSDFDRVLGLKVDGTELNFGITAHTEIAPATHVFGNISYVDIEADVDDGVSTVTADDTGTALSIGIRHMASDSSEVNMRYIRQDDFDTTENRIEIGALFYLNNSLSIGAGFRTGDDVDTLLINARLDI